MTFASRPPGSSRRARRTVLTIAALSGALLVTACSPSSSGSTDSTGAGGDGKVTLTVWSWRVEDEAAYNKIFQAYEKSHPNVNVEFKAFKATEYNKILATGLAGSSGPDVPQVRSYGQLQGTVASKSLLPLDGKVDLSGWDENVVASAKGKEDGKTYSVPLARQTVQMFYNQGLFDKNGLKAPTTWDGVHRRQRQADGGRCHPDRGGRQGRLDPPDRARGRGRCPLRRQGLPRRGRLGQEDLHRSRLGRLGQGRRRPREVHAQERHRSGPDRRPDALRGREGRDDPGRQLRPVGPAEGQPRHEDRHLPGAPGAGLAERFDGDHGRMGRWQLRASRPGRSTRTRPRSS